MLPVVAVREKVNDDALRSRDRKPRDDRYVIEREKSSVEPHVGTAGLLAVDKRELVPVGVQIT
ncbi:MAG TPA: hypothetical protein VF557_17845 [Jatrophihabitans sp.]|uniref:hypothetical protein n=1 Tax=Jatrophihabitans sp. TaxID=1932789 RepID=UPI002F1DA690